MRVGGHRTRVRIALTLAGLVLTAGFVVSAASPAGSATSGMVSVSLAEWKLVPSQAATRAGRVTFVVQNDGSMPHEFLVVRSNRHHHSLPVKGGRAVEAGRRGEISAIAADASKRLTLKLAPGRYVLLCNMLGHYQAGQRAAFRVR